MKCRSVINNAFEPDLPALHFDQSLCDIQPQPCAWNIAYFLIFSAEEFLEDLLLVFWADANTGVSYKDMNNLGGSIWIPLVI
jgi:hypothetical protein